jgi:hypothetical protein
MNCMFAHARPDRLRLGPCRGFVPCRSTQRGESELDRGLAEAVGGPRKLPRSHRNLNFCSSTAAGILDWVSAVFCLASSLTPAAEVTDKPCRASETSTSWGGRLPAFLPPTPDESAREKQDHRASFSSASKCARRVVNFISERMERR